MQLSTTLYTPFNHWFRHCFWLGLPDASDPVIPGRLDHEDPPLADAIDRPHALMPTPGDDIEAVIALNMRAERDRSPLKR